MNLINRAAKFGKKTAIVDSQGHHTYEELLKVSQSVALRLLNRREDLKEERISFLVSPGFEYAAVQWGIWRAGGIAVPLCAQHPALELKYVLEDSKSSQLVCSADSQDRVRSLGRISNVWILPKEGLSESGEGALPTLAEERRAMILYTSGTTSKPKGVVLSHKNISAQIESLCQAWKWTPEDRILHVLPLHHIHGIINVLSCALWSGSTCEMFPEFDAGAVIERISQGNTSLFMAVPTIYVKLINHWEQMPKTQQEEFSKASSKMRLMVSGSAALPVSVLEKWRQITGHTLLERYGMTEIGMALSNPYEGERRPGHVGLPLPGVEIQLADEKGKLITQDGVSGEIMVRGNTVFREYWQKPKASTNAFIDGWFKTGDIAVMDAGSLRIQGRNSVDIIKSGGYKISALEIEEVLRTHPKIRECAVVGVEDDEWGERVSAAIVLARDQELGLDEMRTWAGDKLAKYKIPSRMMALEELPRNLMGKVTKSEIKNFFLRENA